MRWPKAGRHILANFDANSIVVYQAYRSEIGQFAAREQYFGGAFNLGRMSWVKPNFLWMMYRSGWATKPSQEVVLAVRISRSFFDEVLDLAIHSSYVAGLYQSHETWRSMGKASEVRLQWDPDHAPSGAPCERRAVQLGLRGTILARYAREAIIGIEDISEFVAEQRARLEDTSRLTIPRERVYPLRSLAVRTRLGVDSVGRDESSAV